MRKTPPKEKEADGSPRKKAPRVDDAALASDAVASAPSMAGKTLPKGEEAEERPRRVAGRTDRSVGSVAMAEDSSPPPADEAPAGAFPVADELLPEVEIFEDLLGRLLREGGVARDSESSSYLIRFLEQLHIDENLGIGKGRDPPSQARHHLRTQSSTRLSGVGGAGRELNLKSPKNKSFSAAGWQRNTNPGFLLEQ